MGTLTQDLHYAFRGMLKRPIFTLVVVLSIGLAIGVNTTVFAWLQNLVLNPWPSVPDAGRLVALRTAAPGGKEWSISYPAYLDWRDASVSFDGIAVQSMVRMSFREEKDGPSDRAWGQLVSENYFDLLGVPARLGRTFRPEEETTAAPVAVISSRMFETRFRSDPGVIGRAIFLNGHAVTIIGVAEARFGGTAIGLGFDLWAPVTLQPFLRPGQWPITTRGYSWLDGFARLKPGVTLAQAREELQAVALNASRAAGETPATGAVVRLMREQPAGKLLMPLFSALLGVTTLVLLIACANVANLLLARGAARSGEIAVRLALGANRTRIVRQLLTESLLLSAMGGGTGLLFTGWARGLLILFVPPAPVPISLDIRMNPVVLGFALLATLLSALVFGLVPALRTSRTDLVPALSGAGRGAAFSRSRLSGALVVAQFALCVVALVCAGLFLRSMTRARAADIGIADPSKLLLVTTDLNLAGLDGEAALAAADRVLDLARSLPGVSSAGFATMVPLGFGGHSQTGTTVEGYEPGPDENMSLERVMVSDGYFEAMGIPIERGRSIERSDRSRTERVAVVNQAFVRKFWPGKDPIGRRLHQGQGWAKVVGVAKDSACDELGETPYPVVYSSLAQWYASGMTLHVRTEGDPMGLIGPLHRRFSQVSPDLPFLDPRSMTQQMGASTFVQRTGASVLSVLGILALILSATGIYAVLACAVQSRRREIAVRAALGASRRDLVRLVADRALRLTLSGLVIGMAGALGAAHLLRSQLFGVDPGDPATFGSIALILLAVAAAGAFVPARRAAGIDPAAALRSE